MTSWGVGERGVARMYGCAPLFILLPLVSGVAPAGGVGGREPGPLARYKGGLM
jgi:hypothetical protein